MANPNSYSALFTTDPGGTSVIANKNSFALVQRGNQIFSLGGFNGSVNTSAIEMSTYVDGQGLTGWKTIGNLPAISALHAATMVGDWIYMIGGAVGTQVLSIRVESNGTITEMYTEAPFPVTIASHRVLAFNNRLYALAGVQNSSYSTDCWFCDIGGNGRPVGNWQKTTPTPDYMGLLGAVVTYDGAIITSGGDNSTQAITGVYTSQIQGNGQLGAWQAQAPMNAPRFRHSMVLLGNGLYVFGGYNYTTNINSVENCELLPGGKISQAGWQLATSISSSLFVPSTTGPDGITFTAKTPGSGGSAISVTFNAPAGGSTTVAVVGNAITVSPAAGALNSDVVTAVQGSAPANALVSVAATGPGDAVIAFATANLAGGVAKGVALLGASGRHQPAVFANGSKVYLIGGLNASATQITIPQVFKRY